MICVVSDPRQFFLLDHINRGYYMAGWRYKISLQVLKQYFSSECSEWVKCPPTEEEF